MSLRLQVNLIIIAMMAVFASILIGLQLDNTRRSVREEVVSANVVAGQFLSRLQWIYGNDGMTGIAEFLSKVGRIRANAIELRDDSDQLIYRSPPSVYKAGLEAPEWYSRIVSPPLPARVIQLPNGRMILQADTSRAVLDGWDELRPMLWTVLLCFLLGNALVYALMRRALKPLHRLSQGLLSMADGRYDTRLTQMTGHEGRQMGLAFNRMAQSVQDSIEARKEARKATQELAENRELTQMIQDRIEIERGAISRELHDELGQQVTAIKSVSLAIAQRAEKTDPSIESSARLVMACADQIYDGMHRLIATLRPLALDRFGLHDALLDLLADSRMRHPKVQIEALIKAPLTDLHASLATAIYRIIQEALNNALRHAQAQCIEITVSSAAGQLDIQVVDDGLGQVLLFETHGHFGLPGMRERAEALGGTLRWLQRTPTGVVIQATLPDIPKNSA
ncbi:MAG: HAMP domain-containing protein [Limnohabitans sp.]|nr:HAMP domain-containing protein [Limnohabitans sp.]